MVFIAPLLAIFLFIFVADMIFYTPDETKTYHDKNITKKAKKDINISIP